jgi:hypothetical protein
VVGLDHFALRVRDRLTLEGWAKHLDQHDVPHSGIQEEWRTSDRREGPDNIQVELWAFDPDLVELGKPTDKDVFFVYHGPAPK